MPASQTANETSAMVEAVTIVVWQGIERLTANDCVKHTAEFSSMHDVTVILWDPSSPLTVVDATEITADPPLRTEAVSFERLVEKVFVKAQPDTFV